MLSEHDSIQRDYPMPPNHLVRRMEAAFDKSGS